MAEVLCALMGGGLRALLPIPTYPDSIVYEAMADTTSVVFKANDPDGRDRDGIALEAWALATAASAGVPTPAVLEVDTSSLRFPASFMVMERAHGVPLDVVDMDPCDAAVVVRSLGAILRRLHSIRLAGFGWLDESRFRRSGQVGGVNSSWRDALMGDVPAALDYLAATVLSPPEVDRLRLAIESVECLLVDPPESVLLHGDIDATTHVWIDPATRAISSLLDFGERASGDWLWDFVEFDPRCVPLLAEGYGAAGDALEVLEDRLSRYRLLKAVPWAHKWHERGEPQVVDRLRHVLAAAEQRL